MKKENIDLIIVKYLNREANYDDLVTLDLWLRNDANIETFNQFIKTEYLLSSSMKDFDIEEAKRNIQQKLKYNRRKYILRITGRAAAVVIAIGLFSLLFTNRSQDVINQPKVVNNTIAPIGNKAILTLGNGQEVVLEEGKSVKTDLYTSSGKDIKYQMGTELQTEPTTYNYLTVPRGGQYQIQLSDNTKIWLNSETQLRYPEKFKKGEPRVIELVYGEAYFEVSSSKNNEGASFKVYNSSQEVAVLGTKFNIKAYKDETHTYTTLIEGSVSVATKDKNAILTPSYQAITQNNVMDIRIEKSDITEAIAWKNGIFSFKNMTLKDIMRTLSRWYDFEVVFIEHKAEYIQFTGVLGKDQSIEDILSIITNANDIAYEIKNNTVIFK